MLQIMTTFSKQQMAVLSAETGFLRDNLEKVLRLSEILSSFEHNAMLNSRFVLKGGTAINLTIFEMPRLSVDIDLDYCNDCDREEMLYERGQANAIILSMMENNGYTLSPSTKSPHSLDSWVFSYTNCGGNRDNIKIEINYSMRCHILNPVVRTTSVPFLPVVKIRTLAPLELFGSKIKALVERAACRDLYDVSNMIDLSVFSDNDLPLLCKIVVFYLMVGGNGIKAHCIPFQKISDINFRQIRASLIPVLRKSERFNFEDSKQKVMRFLSELLILSDDELSFIDYFNQGIYRPELLFQNQEIISRIKNHPMAIWKMKDK